MSPPIYIAALPILHNGRAYEPGDVFDATAPGADVAHLLESAALRPAGAPAHPSDADGPADASAAAAPEDTAAEGVAEALDVLRSTLADLAARVGTLEDEGDEAVSREAHRQAVEALERRVDVLEGAAPPPASPSREERYARILEAVGQLDRAAGGDWTASGVPAVAALERLSGLTDVTAAERDAAWAAVQSGD